LRQLFKDPDEIFHPKEENEKLGKAEKS
jgi:hypothetical protein